MRRHAAIPTTAWWAINAACGLRETLFLARALLGDPTWQYWTGDIAGCRLSGTVKFVAPTIARMLVSLFAVVCLLCCSLCCYSALC